ncbi:hypothetical protein ACO0K0_16275 [Undibacterium sp. SXout11W]|uniref:hypothetical protein n=1 Tax=Undibacterium sp. SXout11W TaxID=3413050 RepID=UPI003BF10E47
MKNDSNQTENQKQLLFSLGQVLTTRGAFDKMTELGISAKDLIFRHVTGDWGDLCESDQQENVKAIHSEAQVFSSYIISTDIKIWIITEADRSSTTLLLPDEY